MPPTISSIARAMIRPAAPRSLGTAFDIGAYEFGASSLDGDYNQNGVVDAGDYVVWRKNDRSPQGYQTWRTHFDQTTGSDSSNQENATVPEPVSLVMHFMGTPAMCFRRRSAAIR